VAGITVPLALRTSSSGRQLTVDQLQAGDCLTGSNLGLGTSSPWPDQVTAVPCTQLHLAEVFFAGNAWPQSPTKYPGTNAIKHQSDDRCNLAFGAYDGAPDSFSIFTFDEIVPTPASDWASGDRRLVCLAYSGTTSVNFSIKRSFQ
jgi:hypothetical protein